MTEINPSQPMGGFSYPWLQGDWKIISVELTEKRAADKMAALMKQNPTLVTVRDSAVVFVFGELTHKLNMSMKKGGFVLSKRISRLIRPYRLYDFVSNLKVVYHDHSAKTWDGAALINRKTVMRLAKKLTTNMDARKRAIVLREIKSIGRVEFTLQSERGQDKGHALVVDGVNFDLYLPQDTKTEIKMQAGPVSFLGISPVHGKENIWLDQQSLVNLHPFFPQESLVQWLDEEGDRVINELKDGKVNELLEKLTVEQDENQWLISKLAQAGFDIRWSAHLSRMVTNVHLKRLESRTLTKMRLPIPGQRLYVMVDAVGQRKVNPGYALLDPENGTIWVSESDWPELSAVWGGADQDDGMWVFPFKLKNGHQRLLVWRSPNQQGEYVVLKSMTRIAGEIPQLDPKVLPPRIDQRNLTSLGYIPHTNGHKDIPYTKELMWPAITRATANVAALGMFCNILMIAAATGTNITKFPALLEEVVDATVKTGEDMSRVKHWCKMAAQHLLPHELPQILHHRIENLIDEDTFLIDDPQHWMSVLMACVEAHISMWTAKREDYLATLKPPTEVLVQGGGFSNAGGKLRQLYYDQLGQEPKDADFERARRALETELIKFGKDARKVLLGMWANAYFKAVDKPMSDLPIWVQTNDKRKTSIADLTLQSLQEIGVLGRVVKSSAGLVRFYEVNPVKLSGTSLNINGVWFSHAQSSLNKKFARMGEIPKPLRDKFKAEIAERAARGYYTGREIELRKQEYGEDEIRLLAYDSGHLIGYASRGTTFRPNADGRMIIRIDTVGETDGNLIVVGELS